MKHMNQKLSFWIQGMDPTGKFTGKYDSIDMPAASYAEIIKMIERMPQMPKTTDDICPPQLGFPDGNFCLSKDSQGGYFLYPHQVNLTLADVPRYLQAYWAQVQGYPFDSTEVIPGTVAASPRSTKFCIFCGEKIKSEAIFCPSCGKKQ
jgi:hypothetical protein